MVLRCEGVQLPFCSAHLNDARNRTNTVSNAHRVRLRVDLGIADGMSIRGGHFEYRHAHTRAMDMLSAMPR